MYQVKQIYSRSAVGTRIRSRRKQLGLTRKEMAEATIKLLFDLIRKKPVEFRQVYEAELVVRQSTKRIQ